MKRTAQHYREIIAVARNVHRDPEHFGYAPGGTVNSYARSVMAFIDDLAARMAAAFEGQDATPATLKPWLVANLKYPWQ